MANKETKTETTETRKERGWALIQVRADTHKLLKEYCDEHGFKMSALTNNLIRKYIQSK
jgi:hypothetical protein